MGYSRKGRYWYALAGLILEEDRYPEGTLGLDVPQLEAPPIRIRPIWTSSRVYCTATLGFFQLPYQGPWTD